MDKETIINVCNNTRITIDIAEQIIREYCLEKGKDPQMIEILLSLPINHMVLLDYALEYYKQKFEICIIKDTENNIIKVF